MSGETVILGLSGGVDSAVAALLLRDGGYRVHGAFLDIGRPGEADSARALAASLKLPLRVLDIRAELEAKVCRPFVEGYLRGETPNPCVVCNPLVKFPALYRLAAELGAEFVATGHYAKAKIGSIFKGERANDQSYMLCRLTREQVAGLILPLGAYEKREVRDIARGEGLSVAEKPDSMEICFIPDGDFGGYIESRGEYPPPGDFVDVNGRVLGRHRGVHRYTLGQRRGLGVAAGRRVFVAEIRPETNEITLSDGAGLYANELIAADFNWLDGSPAPAPFRASVKVRHSKLESPALVEPHGESVRVVFDAPVRAPAKGQQAAVYVGDRLLGGGFIV